MCLTNTKEIMVNSFKVCALNIAVGGGGGGQKIQDSAVFKKGETCGAGSQQLKMDEPNLLNPFMEICDSDTEGVDE